MTTTTQATSPEKNREREEKQITIFQRVEQETEQARPTTTKAKSRTQKKLFKKRKTLRRRRDHFRPWRTRRNKHRQQSSTESRHARPARRKSYYSSLTPRDLLFPFGAAFFLRCPGDAIGGESAAAASPLPNTHFLLHHHHFFPLLHQYFPIIRTTQLNANTQNGSYQRARGERNRERAEREREREREKERVG